MNPIYFDIQQTLLTSRTKGIMVSLEYTNNTEKYQVLEIPKGGLLVSTELGDGKQTLLICDIKQGDVTISPRAIVQIPFNTDFQQWELRVPPQSKVTISIKTYCFINGFGYQKKDGIQFSGTRISLAGIKYCCQSQRNTWTYAKTAKDKEGGTLFYKKPDAVTSFVDSLKVGILDMLAAQDKDINNELPSAYQWEFDLKKEEDDKSVVTPIAANQVNKNNVPEVIVCLGIQRKDLKEKMKTKWLYQVDSFQVPKNNPVGRFAYWCIYLINPSKRKK